MKEAIEKYLHDPVLSKLIIVFIGIAIIWSATKFIKRALTTRIKDNGTRYKVKKVVSFAGYALTLLLLGITYSSRLGGLTVAFGIAGAGIAFSLQEVIASFAGWMAVMLGGFYRPGDRVQLGGIKGDVMDVGVLRTTLMEIGEWVDGDLYNGRIVLIANSFIFKSPVFNYSGDFPFLWDEIKIPVQFGSNYEKARKLFIIIGKRIACDLSVETRSQWIKLQNKYRLEETVTEPVVSIVANDNWVEFTIRYAVAYKQRRFIKTELFLAILREIEATNGEIKFASATFQLVDVPDLKIKLQH